MEAVVQVQDGFERSFSQPKYVSTASYNFETTLTFLEAGEPTGSITGPPPPVSDEVTSSIQNAAKKDSMGQNVAGKDQQGNNNGQTVIGEAGKEKTAKESMQDPEAP